MDVSTSIVVPLLLPLRERGFELDWSHQVDRRPERGTARDILSLENPAYRQLVKEQEDGHFRPICRSCDYYKSIYRTTKADRKLGRSPHALQEFLAGSPSAFSGSARPE